MAQQQPPPQHAFPNYGYMQQPQQFHQNGQQQQNPNLVNGYPQMAPQQPPINNFPQQQQPMKPMAIPAQQVPLQQPSQTINYQNFQTNALHTTAASGINGSNSALSSRTSSPGMQAPNMIPTSQLPPSKSYPSYQPLQQGQQHQQFQQQQPQPMAYPVPQNQQPPSQIPSSMAPPVMTNNNNNINNNIGDNNQATSMPPNLASHQLSASMKNLSINPLQPQTFPSPSMPSSKSDQNLLNNNNMQQPPKPMAAMQKRPMYPQQQPMPPQQQQQQQPQVQQNQFNSFPGVQQPQMQPNVQQQPQARGNLQYQNFQQQPQSYPAPTAAPGNVVQQGFNRMWGRETLDLMQHRHILPQTKVLPPPIKLNQQFHEAVNCSPDIFRCTLTKIPESNSLLQKSRLPLGILIHPYRDLSVSVRFFHSKTYYRFSRFLFPFLESTRYQLLFDRSLSSVSHLHQSICIFRR